jgi:hypothetical protein
MRSRLIIAFILLAISVVSFGILYFVGDSIHPIIFTILDIASWVFAWESVDQMFIQRHFFKVQEYKSLQIIYAKITFRRLIEDR